jgi:hypothetical protein
MNMRAFLASALTVLFCWTSASAGEDEYISIELAQPPMAITVGDKRPGGYWVQMTQSVSPDYGILADQSWDNNDIDENWYQIYSEERGPGFCLTVIPSKKQGLDTVVVLNACESGNLSQAWSNMESGDSNRFYNASMPKTACLTGIPRGEQKGLLTMNVCGSGDLSTELWSSQDTGRPIKN